MAFPRSTTVALSIPRLMPPGAKRATMAAASSHLVDELSLVFIGVHSMTPPGAASAPAGRYLSGSTYRYSAMAFSSAVTSSADLLGHHTHAPPTAQKKPLLFLRLPSLYPFGSSGAK